MYINDTHIGFYLLATLAGLVIGQLIDWANERLIENKKVISTDIFRKYKIDFKPNYILMLTTALLYLGLVYKFGVQDSFIENLSLIKYIILIPMLLCVFTIDYKKQIIPNRLNLTIFEIGIIISFLYGLSNVAITIDMLLGMIAGAVIFAIIALIGGLIYEKKDAIGLGDIKLITALGLYFGLTNIVTISVISFIIGAIIAIAILITKRKKINENMSFGPSIVIASLITIFVPFQTIALILKMILTLGLYKK